MNPEPTSKSPTPDCNGAERPYEYRPEPNPLETAAFHAGQSKAIFQESINIAVKNERERISKEVIFLRDFFRDCARTAERHASVAKDCVDRHASGGSQASYTRAANHLSALLNSQFNL